MTGKTTLTKNQGKYGKFFNFDLKNIIGTIIK